MIGAEAPKGGWVMESIITKNDNLIGVRAIYSNGELVYEDRKELTDSKSDFGQRTNSKRSIKVQ